MDAAQPFGYQPPPAGAPMMHPARAAALGAPVPVGTPPQVGMVRSADEMEDGADGAYICMSGVLQMVGVGC